MGALFGALAAQVQRYASTRFQRRIRRFAWVAIGGALLLLSVVFVLVGVFVALSRAVGPIGAAFVISGILALMGLLVLQVGSWLERRKAREVATQTTMMTSEVAALSSVAGASLSKLAVPAAGLLVGYVLLTRLSGGGGDDEGEEG